MIELSSDCFLLYILCLRSALEPAFEEIAPVDLAANYHGRMGYRHGMSLLHPVSPFSQLA